MQTDPPRRGPKEPSWWNPRRTTALRSGLFLLIAAVFVWMLVRPGRTASLRVARDQVAASVPGEWDAKIRVSVGPWILGLGKLLLALAPLEPQARLALNALHGASVGIYELRFTAPNHSNAALLATADERLTRRGWERMVGVIDHQEVVAVYAPQKMSSWRDVAVCVLVKSDDELVIVSARGNLEDVVDFALKRLRKELRPRLRCSNTP